MSTHDTPSRTARPGRAGRWARWSVPVVAAVIGAAYLVAGLVGHDRQLAVVGPAVMLAAAVGFEVASRYSETVAGLRDRGDERINALDATASLAAGLVVITAVIVMFVVEVARGEDGSPYYQLGALGGVTYVVALVWLRFRR